MSDVGLHHSVPAIITRSMQTSCWFCSIGILSAGGSATAADLQLPQVPQVSSREKTTRGLSSLQLISKFFGCTLDFEHPTMQTHLKTRCWKTLQTQLPWWFVTASKLFIRKKSSSPYPDIPSSRHVCRGIGSCFFVCVVGLVVLFSTI